jgi:hypothetical protein
MTQFLIPVIEYDCPRPGHPLKPPIPPFVVNERQLVVELIRSVLTANSGRASRKFMAAIVKPTLQFLLDWSATPNLRVSPHFLKVLRDFSATTRIGELAQGVSCAYWKWGRGYSWIADFGSWAAGLQPPYTGSKSPDFVMLNMDSGDLAVMEAKGTGSHCHKTAMGLALRQCKDAAEHKAFSRGFGSILTLDTANPSNPGTLHVRDPENGTEPTDELRFFVFRRSYASWFELVGDDDLADKLRCEMVNGDPDLSISTQRIDQGQQVPRGVLRTTTATALGFDPGRTRFGVSPIVSSAFSDFELFKRTDWQELRKHSSQISPPGGPTSIYFPDGTWISED